MNWRLPVAVCGQQNPLLAWAAHRNAGPRR